ncbi:tyrosine transporter TyrP [Bergeriella denitrificans]|uniref:Tyrosine transporter TyrP n=2 Tax=Bergeriella denitrificans TaxID=494 RepID=A0A378UIK9_BERDE|nr:amino acid permease [Bergeriella denitrificans]STZ77198.1 tyrosine transporter TyrP [Bergeriella denitrificans]
MSDVLKTEKITFTEGVAMIIGTNIGAGILSVSYAARKAGYLPLLFWLVVVGIITTVTMLYVAEATLRTKQHEQLSGLAKRYVGGIGSWLMFASVTVNALGALIAYMSGSGDLMHSLFGIDKKLGSIIFFIPAALVLGLGLKALGRSEKLITGLMVLMLSVLIGATLLFPSTDFSHLLDGDWMYMIPVFNLVVFIYCAQYIVPEMARGLAHAPKQLPKAIITGMLCTFTLIALVPLSVISLNGLDNVSQVATISWGTALGSWAFFMANGFALFAMLTSYWGIGGSFLTNIADRFSLPVDSNVKVRCGAVALVALPPFALAYSGLVGFVDALYFAGAFSGVVLSILPYLIVRGARSSGNRTPEWQCPAWMSHPLVYGLIFLLYSLSAVYAVLAKLDLLPAGW